MLQGFGCEQVGFMDNFDDCSVRLAFTHHGLQLAPSRIGSRLGGDVLQEKPVVVAASGVEIAMGAGRARSEADRGQLDPARLGQRRDHRHRNRHLSGCNRLLTVFRLGSTTMKAGQG